MKLCPGAALIALAALLSATLPPLAPSPLSAQTTAFQPPTGVSLEPRVVYLGTFVVEGTASCFEQDCGFRGSEFSSEASASVGPGLRLEVAGVGPLILAAGVAATREIHVARPGTLGLFRLAAAYRLQPTGWLLPVQLEAGVTHVRGTMHPRGEQRWRLWGPNVAAELMAPLSRRLTATGGIDLLLLFPSHGTVMIAARQQLENVLSAKADRISVPEFHVGLAIRLGQLQ